MFSDDVDVCVLTADFSLVVTPAGLDIKGLRATKA
jgi:hypothetical protein